MKELWQSDDRLVRVITDVYFPEPDSKIERDYSDLERSFRSGAWIVVWYAPAENIWKITKSNRFVKPNLFTLTYSLPEEMKELWSFYGSGTAGRQRECDLYVTDDDAIAIAQWLYASWQDYACVELRRTAEKRGINLDEFVDSDIPASLRPGIPLLRSYRAVLRDVYDESL